MNELDIISLEELLTAKPEIQHEWLKSKYLNEANEAEEDIVLHLQVKAWDEPIGTFVEFDLYRFDDIVKSPEAYDLGWDLQSRMTDISDDRAMAINDGAILTASELEETKCIVQEAQLDSDDGTYCSGFSVSFSDNATCFAAYTGKSLGQGGINYEFYRIFADKNSSIEHLSQKGDQWIDLTLET